MFITLAIISVFFWSSGIVFSLVMPYYQVDPNSTLLEPLKYIGYDWAVYPVSIGAIVSMSS